MWTVAGVCAQSVACKRTAQAREARPRLGAACQLDHRARQRVAHGGGGLLRGEIDAMAEMIGRVPQFRRDGRGEQTLGGIGHMREARGKIRPTLADRDALQGAQQV